ncbi:DNA-directed RNA polymerase subunit alpha [Planctomycetales bacterium 10988]|nr:DNA-directed RNA polymerase subunit alpha [Planctomycetales bacterium 10988]
MRVRWRGLQLPSLVTPEKDTLTRTYGKFVAEPFERGFGWSVGNSLRRILLSSLEGSAVTQIKIQGAQHEYATIPGVKEDMTDIVLNVKALVVKNYSEEERVITIEKNTKGKITGADIETDEAVEIINEDHVLCELTDDVPFIMEMVVQNGRGYLRSHEHTSRDREIGIIPIDALFSPVRRVKCSVEETRVGKKTNYDRLVMEIFTDGSIHPEYALVEASKILRKHLNPFVQYHELGGEIHVPAPTTVVNTQQDAELERKLNMSVADLKLSVRAANCLESEDINSLRDLVVRSEDELLGVRNFGDTTLREVKQRLSDLGLHLGMRVPQPSNA